MDDGYTTPPDSGTLKIIKKSLNINAVKASSDSNLESANKDSEDDQFQIQQYTSRGVNKLKTDEAQEQYRMHLQKLATQIHLDNWDCDYLGVAESESEIISNAVKEKNSLNSFINSNGIYEMRITNDELEQNFFKLVFLSIVLNQPKFLIENLCNQDVSALYK